MTNFYLTNQLARVIIQSSSTGSTTMLFEIAFILVAIGICSVTWAVLEILLLGHIATIDQRHQRTEIDRNKFDK